MRLSTWQFCPLKRRRGVGIGMKKNASPAGIDLSQTNNEWRGESLEIFTLFPLTMLKCFWIPTNTNILEQNMSTKLAPLVKKQNNNMIHDIVMDQQLYVS